MEQNLFRWQNQFRMEEEHSRETGFSCILSFHIHAGSAQKPAGQEQKPAQIVCAVQYSQYDFM